MKKIDVIALLCALIMCTYAHAQTIETTENLCGSYIQSASTKNMLFDENMHEPLPVNKQTRFLGFDILEINDTLYLQASAASMNAHMLFIDVLISEDYAICGSGVFSTYSTQKERTTLQVMIPVEDIMGLDNSSSPLQIEVLAINANNDLTSNIYNYDRQALNSLINTRLTSDQNIPYSLAVTHPTDTVGNYHNDPQRNNKMIYCALDRYHNCDYSLLDFLDVHDQHSWHLALPIKGQFTIDAHVVNMLFREDLTAHKDIIPTDFGVWYPHNSFYELGASRQNVRAFLSPFFTLTHSIHPQTGKYQTTISWDIPLQHGEFQGNNHLQRSHEIYWMMNFAFTTNEMGPKKQALTQGVSQHHYTLANKVSFLSLTGIKYNQASQLNLLPLIVN
ncbi:hypothetical protein CWB96_20140 [Pseudoalteromonas citrea]|uniref:Uncharacterized protein n=1 Tax=Pseudoalteromonas citrea TaxID=43655 RepID=A0A5S3XIU7_9GAMM|nr:hypothetical protein [Pseudoalteromonas citrea]TMP41192.1 hypothetical protein CWB97_15550 [Pseudoalteromonas citrea]TMP54012.1 hypothetical protein CWB96_20140 [Pseudoalteromonas citrea]